MERTPDDLYQDTAFPNYHYVKCVLEEQTLKSIMYRAAEPENADSKFEQKDSFTIETKPRKVTAAVQRSGKVSSSSQP